MRDVPILRLLFVFVRSPFTWIAHTWRFERLDADRNARYHARDDPQ
jgi:hypothetical protein